MRPRQPLTGTVVVRAWVEPGSPAEDVRARVLVIIGPNAEVAEIGAAAGLDDVLSLVADGLLTISGGRG